MNISKKAEKKKWLEFIKSILAFEIVGIIMYMGINHVSARNKKTDKSLDTIMPSYEYILDNYCELMNNIDFNNPNDVNSIYNYLLKNGYFTNGKFAYGNSNTICSARCYGLDVMDGSATCLSQASLLNDILKKMGYTSYLCSCDIYSDDISFITRAKKTDYNSTITEDSNYIDNNTPNNNDSKNDDKNQIGNHAIVIIKIDDYWLGFDPTNSLIFDVNGTKLDLINGYGTATLNMVIDTNQNSIHFFDENAYETIIKESITDNPELELALHSYLSSYDYYQQYETDIEKFKKNIEQQVTKIDNYIKIRKKDN